MSLPLYTQRWRAGSPRWRPANERGFDPARYEVAALDENSAATYVQTHHYAKTMPSTTYRYGLFDHQAPGGRALVGVATLGVPMHQKVLTNAFPRLTPYVESLEFNRLVLDDSVAANGESWFCARMFEHAATLGVRGLVTFADPVPRWRTTGAAPELIKPGHCGVVYQALNFTYTGRATARSLTILPDATVITARALAKVANIERGHRGVITRLVALGAPQPEPSTDLKRWLRLALRMCGARQVRHPGNHRYLLRIGTRSQRTRVLIAMPQRPYPKPQPELALT